MKIGLIVDLFRFLKNPLVWILTVFVFGMVGIYVGNRKKSKTIKAVSIILSICLILSYPLITFFSWDYSSDIDVDVPYSDISLVVKEKSYLSVTASEIYLHRYGFDIYLGEIPGGDDGYSYFRHSNYSVKAVDDLVTIECGNI